MHTHYREIAEVAVVLLGVMTTAFFAGRWCYRFYENYRRE